MGVNKTISFEKTDQILWLVLFIMGLLTVFCVVKSYYECDVIESQRQIDANELRILKMRGE